MKRIWYQYFNWFCVCGLEKGVENDYLFFFKLINRYFLQKLLKVRDKKCISVLPWTETRSEYRKFSSFIRTSEYFRSYPHYKLHTIRTLVHWFHVWIWKNGNFCPEGSRFTHFILLKNIVGVQNIHFWFLYIGVYPENFRYFSVCAFSVRNCGSAENF
jgi:hypothetical protein